MLDALLIGLEVVFSWQGLLAAAVGVAIGILVGALPGLGPAVGIALLIPFTYDMPAAIAMVLLVSVYVGGEYGGSISAILIAVPGTAAATATVMDGYPLNRKGQAGFALAVSLSASCLGGLIGGIALTVLLEPLVGLALRFSPAAYFSVALLALTSVASLSAASPAKGLLAAGAGLAIASIGIDPISGVPRFTFGRPELAEGVPLLVAIIGLFALSEVLHMAGERAGASRGQERVTLVLLSLRRWLALLPTMLRGSVVGVLTGILPGVGASVGGWLAYDLEKRFSREAERFGSGVPAGIAAPEAANNASVGGALVPMLALGVPGSATTAVLIGALVLHGLQPGPQLLVEAPEVAYGLFVTLAISVVMMFLFGTLVLPLWVRLISLPRSVLAAIVLALGLLGAYAVRNLVFDLWLALAFGVLGYLMKLYRFPVAPMILGLVLFHLIEGNYRRTLLLSRGSHQAFVTDPLSALFLALAAAVLVWPFLAKRRRPASVPTPDDRPEKEDKP